MSYESIPAKKTAISSRHEKSIGLRDRTAPEGIIMQHLLRSEYVRRNRLLIYGLLACLMCIVATGAAPTVIKIVCFWA